MKPRSSSKGFTSNVAADGQLFLGNSFFGRGGVELRQYRTTVRERFFVSGKDAKGKYETSEPRGVSSFRNIGLTFGIDNDWIDGPHALFIVPHARSLAWIGLAYICR